MCMFTLVVLSVRLQSLFLAIYYMLVDIVVKPHVKCQCSAQEAYPGDVIGVNNPGHFAIGDTIFTGSTRVRFPGIPSFSPECFAYMRNPNPSKYKNYRKGLDQARHYA